ncbi:hypothetical protein [Hymenobacter jejuensis]|uniref:STAS domain-containing protein n=1 Tax=Hymenobacter jejuensis TaxID=2502781 RepID=A0A5B8A4L3_9BACT|nr:hypothetical protein [Hymenobacter jejuensis]QDA61553.1 hypothetical protein FHG12_16255 [Hymenobacter jejuensis]
MNTSAFDPPRQPSSELRFTLFNPDGADIPQMARELNRRPELPRPHLLVDCSRLQCVRQYGVSHFVSQLLLLHQAGAYIVLRNVDPVLMRCLELLKVSHLFHASLGAPTEA